MDMNFIKRGLISVVRKRGKSAILLVLVFILGNVMAGVISIKAAVGNTQQLMREKIGVLASLEADYEAYSRSGATEPIGSVPVDTIEAIGHLKQVKSYDYLTRLWLESSTLVAYYENNGDGRIKPLSATDAPAKTTPAAPDAGTTYSFQLVGGQNPDISDLVHGKITLSQGRVFTADEIENSINVVLVSKKFAELNKLNVGSTFTLDKTIYEYMKKEIVRDLIPPTQNTVKKTFEVSVIGIFEPVDIEGSEAEKYMGSDLHNTIYSTNKAINTFTSVITEAEKQLNGLEYSNTYTQVVPVFSLKDPLELEGFRTEATPLLPKYYKLVDNSASYQYIATPMKNMDWIASIILIVSIGATLVILSLLITLFLRDRRHEMGIYLSLGESKLRVAGQILTEVLLIGIIAITLSLFTGNVIAGNLSGKMLNNQIIAEQENQAKNSSLLPYQKPYGPVTGLDMLGYDSAFSEQELIDSYTVKLGFNTFALFYLVGLGTLLISTAVPILYVTRLNPKKILM